MRAVVQRVTSARVAVDGLIIGEIGLGLLVLLGAACSDDQDDVDYVVRKFLGLRIFQNSDGKMDLSVDEVDGAVMVVSQFTLYGDVRKGRRPSFDEAAPPESARPLYDSVIEGIRDAGVKVATGEFGAMMDVSLVNNGPVTLLLDSAKQF
ncbi:MAG TPA: D-aminoacyl-tRNA deacylase [Vicinamibacterales bacterium]|nr:D-aminoacyl-tRNA deacylase [Vicinamibacterales bacterium]